MGSSLRDNHQGNCRNNKKHLVGAAGPHKQVHNLKPECDNCCLCILFSGDTKSRCVLLDKTFFRDCSCFSSFVSTALNTHNLKGYDAMGFCQQHVCTNIAHVSVLWSICYDVGF